MSKKLYKFSLLDKVYTCLYLTDEDVYPWLTSSKQFNDSPNVVGVDIETYARSNFKDHKDAGLLSTKSKIRTIQFYGKNSNDVVILDFLEPDGSYLLKKENVAIKLQDYLRVNKLVAHNALFETQHLQRLFYTHQFPYYPLNILCTMNAFRLCIQAAYNDPITYKADLKSVARMILGVHIPKEQQMSDWSKVGKLSDEQIKYCAYDAILPVLLMDKLSVNLEQLKMETIFRLNTKAQEVVAHMNQHGIAFDKEEHDLLCEEWKAKEEEFELESIKVLNEDKRNIHLEKFKDTLLEKVSPKYKEEIWANSGFRGLGRIVFNLDTLLHQQELLRTLHSEQKESSMEKSL